MLEGEFLFGEGRVASSEPAFDALILKSEDQKLIAQLGAERFTVNRLAPYADWEELLPRAMDIWTHYREVLGPERIVRIAVRYINDLHFPATSTESLETYLTSPPVLPNKLNELQIVNFMTRFVLFDPATRINTSVTQALQGSSEDNIVHIVLDFDCFLEDEFDPKDTDSIYESLLALRHAKNQAFFSSITDTTVRLYK